MTSPDRGRPTPTSRRSASRSRPTITRPTGSTGTTRPRKVGHYLYLAAEKDDLLLRRESVFILLPDGSVLAQHGAGRGSHGRTAAGDRLRLECLEPFRRWRGRYAGPAHRLAGDEIVAGPRPGSELVEMEVEIEVESVAAPWNTEGDWGEQPPSLRYHQFYDARGTVTVGGTAYPFAGPGFRSHSRRRRDMPGFTGHAIINGRFPSGRGFGLLRYRATADRPERGRGFLYLDGAAHDADVVTWPHLDQAVAGGERLTIELHAGRHKAVISAVTIASAFVTPAPDGRQLRRERRRRARDGDLPGVRALPVGRRDRLRRARALGPAHGHHHPRRRPEGRAPKDGLMLTHLQRLEAESIHIIREAVAESERPVMLYSIGKDSAVMLHLARKAFYPAQPPFPLLHVDTTWKFREMYAFRDTRGRRGTASN